MTNQKHSSNEHNKLVELAINKFNGQEVVIRGNSTIKGKYFPDVITDNIDIECELLKNSYLKNKINKWNKTRGKILVIGIPKVAFDNFQEIYIANSKGELLLI